MGGGKRQAAADRLKRLGLRRLLFAGLNLVLLLAMGAALLGVRAMGGTLSTLSAGERFQGENELRFSQLACFMPVGQGKTAEDILKFRIALDASLTEQSLEAPENGSLYLDAYSGSTSVSAAGSSGSASVAAIGVAAHECGHAIQHKEGYFPLKLRSTLVPAANIGSKLGLPIVLLGLILGIGFDLPGGGYFSLAQIGIWVFSLAVLFQVVTLPVEFNASGRALKLLGSYGVMGSDEVDDCKRVLGAAALTYVAAAAASILQLLRLVILARGRSRDD